MEEHLSGRDRDALLSIPYIKEMCVLGLTQDGSGPSGESLHAVIVPDMDEFRRRGQTSIMK